ncbi:hypothetical protein BJI48_05860 [Helicobacter sp. 11S02596-1]|nr:hypothetical protein BJI48_05860 [Helicobacter sp. 11S02596-1]
MGGRVKKTPLEPLPPDTPPMQCGIKKRSGLWFASSFRIVTKRAIYALSPYPLRERVRVWGSLRGIRGGLRNLSLLSPLKKKTKLGIFNSPFGFIVEIKRLLENGLIFLR